MRNYDSVARYGFYGLATESAVPAGGDVFYVDSNSGNAANTGTPGVGDSWDTPFSTVNYAISRCSNGANNVILVAQGHAETISTTSATSTSGTTTTDFCVDKSDVTIIGLGENDQRPTFTLATNTTALIDVQAANCVMANLIFYNTVDGNASMVTAGASADGLVLENCKFYASANSAEAKQQLYITAACNNVTVRGCRFYTVFDGDQSNSAIMVAGTTTHLKITDNLFHGDWTDHVIEADASGASTDIEITDNIFTQLDPTVGNVISLHASSTGAITGNIIHALTGSGAAIVPGLAIVENNTLDLVNQGPNHFYVDSGTGAAANTGKSWATAVTTIDIAVGLCQADNGDVIHVAAGHAEDISGTGTILDMDVADVTIIGEGHGINRPTLTIKTSTTAGNIDWTADDCRMTNMRFAVSTTASMKYMILLSGLSAEIDHCEFLGNASQMPITMICIGHTSDGIANFAYIHDNEFTNLTNGTGESAIDIVKDMDGLRIENNIFRGDWDNACIEIDAAGDACTGLLIKDNIMIQNQTGIGCILISGVTVTGYIIDNMFISDTRDVVCDPAICTMAGNRWSKLGTGMEGIDNVDQNCAGIHFFVDSGATGAGATAGHGYSWASPLSTLAAAWALCTDSNGDIIHVAPGHHESLASAQMTWNKHGVTVRGYGNGTNRPIIDFDHANSSIDITSDNITVENIQFLPDIADILIGIHLGGGATNTTIRNCSFLTGGDGAGADEFIEAIQIGAGDHQTLIENCDFRTHASCGGATNAILLKGTSNEVIIRNNIITGPYSVACIGGDTAASLEVLIENNTLRPASGQPGIELHTGTTGIISDNYISTDLATTAAAIASDGTFMFANLYCEVATETGGLIGTESAND